MIKNYAGCIPMKTLNLQDANLTLTNFKRWKISDKQHLSNIRLMSWNDLTKSLFVNWGNFNSIRRKVRFASDDTTETLL